MGRNRIAMMLSIKTRLRGLVSIDESWLRNQIGIRPLTEIAKEVGISHPTLCCRVRKLGIHLSHGPRKGTPPPNKTKIDEYWLLEQAKFRSSADIAKELGLNGRTVRRRLENLGFDMSSNMGRFNKGISRSPDTEFGGPKNTADRSAGGRALKGRKYPPDHWSRRKGSQHPNWKGGIRKERNGYPDTEYKEWRKSVFERDNYTCQMCGVRGGTIHADHIKRWKDHPESRYLVSNGRTLCAPCHRKTPTYGNRKQIADRTVGLV